MISKTILITGATSGIGMQTALALAKQGHVLYLLVRDIEKGKAVKEQIIAETKNKKITIIACDLSSLASVRAAVDEIKSKLVNVQVLINNAGGVNQQRKLSKDGFELTFALNHLGHFLLTIGLITLLEKGQARIINVSSEAHQSANANFADLQMEKDYTGLKAYGRAKLFNIYFTKSLSERYADKGITAYSLHPGVVNTSFGSDLKGIFSILLNLYRPFMISAEKGAETSIYLATESKIEKDSGKYFKNKKVAKASAAAGDAAARQELWMTSEALVKNYL